MCMNNVPLQQQQALQIVDAHVENIKQRMLPDEVFAASPEDKMRVLDALNDFLSSAPHPNYTISKTPEAITYKNVLAAALALEASLINPIPEDKILDLDLTDPAEVGHAALRFQGPGQVQLAGKLVSSYLTTLNLMPNGRSEAERLNAIMDGLKLNTEIILSNLQANERILRTQVNEILEEIESDIPAQIPQVQIDILDNQLLAGNINQQEYDEAYNELNANVDLIRANALINAQKKLIHAVKSIQVLKFNPEYPSDSHIERENVLRELINLRERTLTALANSNLLQVIETRVPVNYEKLQNQAEGKVLNEIIRQLVEDLNVLAYPYSLFHKFPGDSSAGSSEQIRLARLYAGELSDQVKYNHKKYISLNNFLYKQIIRLGKLAYPINILSPRKRKEIQQNWFERAQAA